VGGSGYTPVLTASSAGGNIDTSGNGWLRMTSSSTNQATYAYDTNSFAAANATITATFNYASYNGSGADGITFFLADASKTFAVGAYGGSLGYAQKTNAGGGGADINGMNGGYIGVGIDEFGNFSNPSEGRVGGTGFVPNAIAVRGPGQGLTGYNYLGGTNGLGTQIAFPSSTTRPTGSNLRTIQVVITATNQMTVYMATGGTTNFIPLYSIDLSGYTRPDSLIMGFTSGTGGSTDIHEIQAVTLSSVVSNLWKNASGDSTWATATNWNNTPAAVPASGSDILLDNTFVSSAQNIAVTGTKVIRNLQIDAPFSYTLSGGTLELNGSSATGPSGIFVSQTHGSATQTIGSNLTADNAIQIQNNSSSTLALTGATVSLGNSTATLNGSGNTTISGIISGTGKIVQSGTGGTTLSGANTYSGGTTLSSGTLTVNNATGLGTGALTITGGNLSSTNGSSIANILTLQGNVGISGITTSGALTQTGGSYVVNLSNATQSGTVNLSNNNTSQTLTVQVDSGNSTISGNIVNGGTAAGNLTKTGNGNLILSGTETYTGTTNITTGSIILGGNNTLANTSSVAIGAAGTLNLNGYSQQIGNLTASAGGATIDFGTAAGNNTFVFGTYTPPASGVLVVNNYQSGSDTLATTVKTSSQGTNGTQTINNSIYISGYGVATENTTTSSTLYGSAYLLTPAAASTNEWKGTSNSTWSTGTNWNNGAKPTTTQIAVFNTLGTARPNVTLDGNNTIAGIQFGNQSTANYTITGNNTLTLSATIPYIQQQSSKDQTLSPSAITISNSTVADITGSGNLTIGANITGGNSSVNLIKDGTGAGKLILTGNNTGLTGSVYINNGIVQAGNTKALGTNTTYVTGGSTLELSGGISPTNALSVSGAGVGSAGAIHNVNGSNTLSGTITEVADTVVAADSGTSLSLTGNFTGTNTNTTLSGAGNITLGTINTGTGAVTVNSTGTTNFSGSSANTYTGTTTLNAGTLTLAKTANVTAVAGNLTINGGTVNENASGQIASTATVSLNGGTLALGSSVTNTFSTLTSASGSTLNLGSGAVATISSSSSNLLSGNITGGGGLATSGTGSVTLGGNNTYSGGTSVGSIVTPISSTAFGTGTVTVNSGGSVETQNTVNLANNFTLNSTGTTAYNGAIENISGNTTISGTVTLAGSSRIQSDSGTLIASGNVALGANTLNVGGAGNTTISGVISGTSGSSLTKDGTGTLALSGTNTFAGTVVVNAGTVLANAANVFNSSNQITVNTGSILNLNSLSETVASITNNGTLALGSGGTLTLSSGASTLGGTLTGSGYIVIGPGTSLTLAANFNAPNVSFILNGGTLNLNGTSDTFGNIAVTTASVLDFGNSAASTLNSSVVQLVGSATLSVTNWVNTVDYFYTQNFVGATLGTRGGTPLNQVTFTGYSSNSTAWQSWDHQITPAPEPATYGAIFTGAALGLLAWRRRNKTAAPVSP
jgi:autotransporter-associated beta strand protein